MRVLRAICLVAALLPTVATASAHNGTIGLFGKRSEPGNFIAVTGMMNFDDGGSVQPVPNAAVMSDVASLISTTDQHYVFPVEITQTFVASLTVLGTACAAHKFRASLSRYPS